MPDLTLIPVSAGFCRIYPRIAEAFLLRARLVGLLLRLLWRPDYVGYVYRPTDTKLLSQYVSSWIVAVDAIWLPIDGMSTVCCH